MMELIAKINDFAWGAPLSIVCLGFGLFLTFYLGVPFVRYFKYMKEGVTAKKQSSEGISAFAAMCVGLGSQVGSGNIAGVATAITIGGPGALFWMWATALFGVSSALCETVLGQIFKNKNKLDDTDIGGPPYYIEKGMGLVGLATLYACVHMGIKCFSSLMVQANTLVTNFSNIGGVRINPVLIGIVVSIGVGVIGFGGGRRIANSCKMIVPFMSLLYVLVAILIMILNIDRLGSVFLLVIKSAFSPQAAVGGVFGAGMRQAFSQGVRRGVYSNNAGQGEMPYSMSRGSVKHPAQQGFAAMLSVAIDTLVICTCTGFMILLASDSVAESGETAIALVRLAINQHLGAFGSIFLSVSLFLFVLTSILANFFSGETDAIWLCRHKVHLTKKAVTLFRITICVSIVLGSTFQPAAVFQIADLFNIFALSGNLIALVCMHKAARECIEDYDRQRKEGIEEPTWDWAYADRYEQARLAKSRK